MFQFWKLWSLRRRRKAAKEKHYKDLAQHIKRHVTPADLAQYDKTYAGTLAALDRDIDILRSRRLEAIADRVDIRIMALEDTDFWVHPDPVSGIAPYLNPTGRERVANRIADNKRRDFDDWAKWLALFMPFIIGLVGVVTGLVAVLQHKK